MELVINMGKRMPWGQLRLNREDTLIMIFVIALGIAVNKYIYSVGGPDVALYQYWPNIQLYILLIIIYICFAYGFFTFRYKPDSSLAFMISSQVAREFWPSVVAGTKIFLAVSLFMASFSLFKGSIPMINGFDWDETFIAWDRAIHGTDPWRILQPVLGYPIVTAALAKLYHLWFLLIYGGSLFFAFLVRDTRLRYRYFFSYFLMWSIGGMAMAAGLASVGPCFLDPVLGNDHFAEQMAYLYIADAAYPVDVLRVQEQLIAWHEGGSYGLGRGISAMPSMHVALAFLFFLAVRKVSKWAGWVFGAFAVLIQVASIHLAYHYAVDGYVSVVLVALIWWAMGKATAYLKPDQATAAAA
jgi:hypothetical protein